MPRFNYVALDSRGQESVGLVEATSEIDAIGQLRQAGYFPTSVYEEGRGRGVDGKKSARKVARVKAVKAPKAKGARENAYEGHGGTYIPSAYICRCFKRKPGVA